MHIKKALKVACRTMMQLWIPPRAVVAKFGLVDACMRRETCCLRSRALRTFQRVM